MNETIFFDSDILFNYLGINPQKKEKFELNGTTDDSNLDLLLNTIRNIKENENIICISNFSVLELICTLNRLKSKYKISDILTKIYDSFNVLNINTNIIQFSWFLGSNNKMHSGDAIHLSFCLYNKIKRVLLKDKGFYDVFTEFRETYKNRGLTSILNDFKTIIMIKKIPEFIISAIKHLDHLTINKIGSITSF